MKKSALFGVATLIACAFALPASAQISPGRTLDPSVRADLGMVHEVQTKKRTKKSKSNVRNKSYSWQNVRGSTSPRYLPNGRGMR